MKYIIAPSSLAVRGLGVGFLYLTQVRTAIDLSDWRKNSTWLVNFAFQPGRIDNLKLLLTTKSNFFIFEDRSIE